MASNNTNGGHNGQHGGGGGVVMGKGHKSMSGDNNEWGWDVPQEEMNESEKDSMATPRDSPKVHSQNAYHNSKYMSPMKPLDGGNGIKSSPSFQELEHAIGATLALSMNNSQDEQGDGSKFPSPSRPGGGNSTNQKWKQQQKRQQMQKAHQIQNTHFRPNAVVVNPMVSAKDEFMPLVLDQVSRALVLFHSPYLNQIQVRDACQKFGVLFYIRPEFHSRGVTLVGYHDIRNAVQAFEELGPALIELGNAAVNSGIVAANAPPPTVEGSAHYTAMLHFNNNSDESQLLIRNIPENVSEADITATFVKYGDIKRLERVSSLHPGSPRGIKRTDSSDSLNTANSAQGNDFAVEINDVIIEYYNIQDSKNVMLTFGSGRNSGVSSGWTNDIDVFFIQFDYERQKLCRQVIQLLSRWKSEQSTSPYNMPAGYQMTMMNMSPHHMYNPVRTSMSTDSMQNQLPLPLNMVPVRNGVTGGGPLGLNTANMHTNPAGMYPYIPHMLSPLHYPGMMQQASPINSPRAYSVTNIISSDSVDMAELAVVEGIATNPDGTPIDPDSMVSPAKTGPDANGNYGYYYSTNNHHTGGGHGGQGGGVANPYQSHVSNSPPVAMSSGLAPVTQETVNEDVKRQMMMFQQYQSQLAQHQQLQQSQVPQHHQQQQQYRQQQQHQQHQQQQQQQQQQNKLQQMRQQTLQQHQFQQQQYTLYPPRGNSGQNQGRGNGMPNGGQHLTNGIGSMQNGHYQQHMNMIPRQPGGGGSSMSMYAPTGGIGGGPQQQQQQQHNGMIDNRPTHHQGHNALANRRMTGQTGAVFNNQADAEYMLDINKIADGLETRTTIMVCFFECVLYWCIFVIVYCVFGRFETFQTSTSSRCYWKK
jgi:hypothetical protein